MGRKQRVAQNGAGPSDQNFKEEPAGVKEVKAAKELGSQAAPENRPDLISVCKALAAQLEPPLTVIDVGCRWGPDPVWQSLKPFVNLIGFDPDEAECERLNNSAAADGWARFLPYALGPRAGQTTLYLTLEPACASVYRPDLNIVARRTGLAGSTPVGTRQIDLVSLDEWLNDDGTEPVDLLKLDVQGFELKVLEGCRTALATASVVATEVEFNPIYEGQPLFGDVDRFLREAGFVLWRLNDVVHYGLPNGGSNFPQPYVHYFDGPTEVPVAGRGGQVFWANALYVSRRLALSEGEDEWRRDARDCCLTAALGLLDLAASAGSRSLQGAPAEITAAVDRLRACISARVDPPPQEDPRTEAVPAEIEQFMNDVSSRLGVALQRRGPSGWFDRSRAGPRPYSRTRHLGRGADKSLIKPSWTSRAVMLERVAFQIALDPAMGDEVSVAYLQEGGHLVEQDAVSTLLQLLTRDDVFIDLGAFLGTFCLPAAAAGCRVVAVEPWRPAADLLTESALINRFERLRVVPAAALEGPGRVVLSTDGPQTHVAAGSTDTPEAEAASFALDDLCDEIGCGSVAAIKMSVEGCELRALRGMKRLLSKDDAPAVLFKADQHLLARYGHTRGELLAELANLGFQNYTLRRNRLPAAPADGLLEDSSFHLAAKKLPIALADRLVEMATQAPAATD